MTTALDGALKRALVIDGEPYTLTITPEGLNLAPKGRRKGHALAWRDLVSGEAALATALNASLHGAPGPRKAPGANAQAPAPERNASSKAAPAGKTSSKAASAGETSSKAASAGETSSKAAPAAKAAAATTSTTAQAAATRKRAKKGV